jgi:hypothetical protein
MKNYKVTIQIKTSVQPAIEKLASANQTNSFETQSEKLAFDNWTNSLENREFYVTAENKLQAERICISKLDSQVAEIVWDIDVNELNVTNPDTVVNEPTVDKTKEQLLIESLIGNDSLMEILKKHLGYEVYTSDDGIEVDGEKYYNESYINDLIDDLRSDVTGEIESYEFEVDNAEFEIRNGNEIEITSCEIESSSLVRDIRIIFNNSKI